MPTPAEQAKRRKQTYTPRPAQRASFDSGGRGTRFGTALRDASGNLIAGEPGLSNGNKSAAIRSAANWSDGTEMQQRGLPAQPAIDTRPRFIPAQSTLRPVAPMPNTQPGQAANLQNTAPPKDPVPAASIVANAPEQQGQPTLVGNQVVTDAQNPNSRVYKDTANSANSNSAVMKAPNVPTMASGLSTTKGPANSMGKPMAATGNATSAVASPVKQTPVTKSETTGTVMQRTPTVSFDRTGQSLDVVNNPVYGTPGVNATMNTSSGTVASVRSGINGGGLTGRSINGVALPDIDKPTFQRPATPAANTSQPILASNPVAPVAATVQSVQPAATFPSGTPMTPPKPAVAAPDPFKSTAAAFDVNAQAGRALQSAATVFDPTVPKGTGLFGGPKPGAVAPSMTDDQLRQQAFGRQQDATRKPIPASLIDGTSDARSPSVTFQSTPSPSPLPKTMPLPKPVTPTLADDEEEKRKRNQVTFVG